MSRPKIDRSIVIGYRLTRFSENGWKKDMIRIDVLQRESVANALAGCVGNVAGYGGRDTAEGMKVADRMAGNFAALLRAGHTDYLASHYPSTGVVLEYQVYKEEEGEPVQHCEPRIDSNENFGTIKRAIALLDKVADKVESIRFNNHKKECLAKGENPWRVKSEGSAHSLESHSLVIEAIKAMGGVEIETFTRSEGNDYPWTELVIKQ